MAKRGRPKKQGARYPSGDLKPPEPNAIVIERRAAGDMLGGEHPLDLALRMAWINEQHHRDATVYRRAFHLAHADAGGPRLAQGGPCEVQPSEALRSSWSQLSDQAIAGIFDRVFNRTAPQARDTAIQEANETWKRLNAALETQQREELFSIAVLGAWPGWMVRKASPSSRDTMREFAFHGALYIIGQTLRPPRQKTAEIVALPVQRTSSRQGMSEAPIIYQTQDGEQITATSERGVPFEATILRRRC